MPDKPTDSLQFFKITTNPPSARRLLAAVWAPSEQPRNALRGKWQLFVILDSKDSRSGHGELEPPKEQTETILRDLIRDIVEETFLSGDDLGAVIEDADQAELTNLAQRGRGREVLESLREDLKMHPLPFRAMAEIALTATMAKYMPFG